MKMLLLVSLVSISSVFAEDVYIIQKNKSFYSKEDMPAIVNLDVNLGDTVYFLNKEADVTHNVYSLTSGSEFELKVQKPNNDKNDGKVHLDPAKFKKGVMEVECAIHPNMRIKLNVK